MAEFEVKTDSISSADGTTIGYRMLGSGPGLVIVHGGMRASQHYLRLAVALANTYTVYIPDRRGRGMSGPAGDHYNMTKELEDLSAILKKTGAQFMFGHSSGGLITLEAALRFPLRKIAVYEPAISIDGSMPTAWFPKFERALAKNDPAIAMATLIKGLRLNASMNLVPAWMIAGLMRFALRSSEGSEMATLVYTFPMDIALVKELESTSEKYRDVRAETLLIGGNKSPAYRRDSLHILAKTIPGAKLREIQGLSHNAPDNDAPEIIADGLKQFLR
jgi:pimeloyl-ACP methyl ester carboxylesterase